VGLDVGSVSADLVVTDAAGAVLESRYVRVLGRPIAVALEELRNVVEQYGEIAGLRVTGSAGKIISDLLAVPFVNEIVAQSKATLHQHPDVRTIIEIGGGDSKLMHVDADEHGAAHVVDLAMNTICAAGTGSFLDQQASRLRVSIEEFSRLALRSERPPRVAGRCSVFAKSDMIHLQQQGTPDYDIIAGLCFAMARNFKANLGRGKELRHPVAFQGGVAMNVGMIRAFAHVLDLEEGEIVIPDQPGCTGALGAVLHVMETGADCSFESLAPVEDYLRQSRVDAERLSRLQDDGYEPDLSVRSLPKRAERTDAYVGVDIGSISTNVVVIDAEMNVLARRYLMTEGRPIEAVKRGLYEAGRKIGERVRVRGCCTTGSGRYLIGEFVGADIVKNEITSHARGAVAMDDAVDTIFEIGGQDAKYISLESGAVVDFAMNKVCAAGTGSFLEEQAERLGLKIEEEFGCAALASDQPVKLGERCTVFMESDLNYYQQRGVLTRDLVAGLCYSIVYNYLNRVVEDRKVGERIFFQGGVAFNRGVKAAFEKVTGKKIIVPPHQDVMGAYGAAIIAMEEGGGESSFRGFDLRGVRYELDTFECDKCSNRCEIHRVSIEAREPLHFGGRCGRYDKEDKHKRGRHLPRLFEERQQALLGTYANDEPDDPIGVTIGIPRALTFFDLYPFWKAFFTELGCRVVLSDPTNRDIIARGRDHSITETCFPIQVAHGHVANLLDKGVDFVFAPSVINMEHEARGIVHSYLCPLVQSLPYMLRAAFPESGPKLPLLAPIFHFERGRKDVSRGLRRLARTIRAPSRRVRKATSEAWAALDRFRSFCTRRGGEVLEALGADEVAVVIMSRAYNGCDSGMNLGLPDKLRDQGVTCLPIDFLPLDLPGIEKEFPHMYWKYGQKIIAAGRYIAARDNLHALYITNFRCGPDSFISKFFDRVLGKPYLTVEIDEHSADVGAITRCEAFLDSIRGGTRRSVRKKAHGEDLFFDIRQRDGNIKIYIPYMDDHGVVLQAALRSRGIDAEALPMSDAESVEIGRRFTTGKECFPCILTTGDIVKKTRCPDFDPDRAGFLMPQASGPCRFGQYHKFHRMVLDQVGLERVPVVVLDQTEDFSDHMGAFGPGFYKESWDVLVIVDYMHKAVREIRPYEVNKGETDAVYQQCLQELAATIERGESYLKKAAQIRRRLDQIPVDRSEVRPQIGIVGEIYVRSNDFANNFLVRKLEEFGAQVASPPFQEWLSYIAHLRRQLYRRKGRHLTLAKELASDMVARWSEGRIAHIFDGTVRHIQREEPIGRTLKRGGRYLDPSVEGEAVLSMGRAIEYAHCGFSGIVNVVPFGCMPGAIVNSLLESFRRDFGGVPVLKVAFDGVEQPSEATVLEAFVHQAREHMLRNRKTAAAALDTNL